MKELRWHDDIFMHMAIGLRGCGPTDYALRLAIMLFECWTCQTVWLRHKLTELTQEGNFESFLNDAHKHEWCPDEWTAKEDGVYTHPKDGDRAIIFRSISTFSNSRGAGHPNVLFAVFDEMIPEDGRYQPNAKMCVKGLLSLMESFTRGREGSFLLVCSNYVTARNPYWAKLHIFNNPKYDVTVFADKACAIEVCRGYNVANKKDSKLSRLKKAAGMMDYGDEKSDPLIGLVEPVPKGAKRTGYVIVSNGLIYRENVQSGISYWEELHGDIPNKTIVLSPNVAECTVGVQMVPKWLLKSMTEQMNNNLLRFSDPNVMFGILDMIYDGGLV